MLRRQIGQKSVNSAEDLVRLKNGINSSLRGVRFPADIVPKMLAMPVSSENKKGVCVCVCV